MIKLKNYLISRLFYVLLLSIWVLIGSCGPIKKAHENQQKKKLEKLINKYEVDSLYKVIEIETIRYDTISIPQKEIDTLFKWHFDTIHTIKRDGVITKIQIRPDTLWLNTIIEKVDTVIEIRDSTIIKEKIKVVNTIPEKGKCRIFNIPCFLFYFLIILIGAVFLIIIIMSIPSIIKSIK